MFPVESLQAGDARAEVCSQLAIFELVVSDLVHRDWSSFVNFDLAKQPVDSLRILEVEAAAEDRRS